MIKVTVCEKWPEKVWVDIKDDKLVIDERPIGFFRLEVRGEASVLLENSVLKKAQELMRGVGVSYRMYFSKDWRTRGYDAPISRRDALRVTGLLEGGEKKCE